MILISINSHFLCISEYESMLVQAGSFWIPFSLLETVVIYIYLHTYLKYGVANATKATPLTFSLGVCDYVCSE